MDFFEIKEKSELAEMLESLWVAVEKAPEGTKCSLSYDGVHLFSPNEGEIISAYGQEITQDRFNDELDERFVCVDGIKVFWLVPKGAGNDPAV